MNRIMNFGLVILTVVAISCSFNNENVETETVIDESTSSTDSVIRKISELVEKHSEFDMFSGTVLVAKNGEVIYEEAFGDANKDYNIKNQLNTRYDIGSIGKTFTAVSIMQLVDKEEINLTDPLGRYLPEFPYDEGNAITIEHLLNHSSGLGDYLEHEDFRCRMAIIKSLADALPLVYDQKPEFPAGEKYQYSNSGYLLLGAIIEKVTGLTYPEYLRKNIFEPIGMDESSITFENEVLPNKSIGYTKNWDRTYTANVQTVPSASSAGGLRTTARDLLKFDQTLYGSELLSELSKSKMFSPSKNQSNYGLGWEIKKYNGEKFVGHSGGADGTESFFYRFTDAGYTIITLSNYDGCNGWVCSDIEAILFGQEYSLPTFYDADFLLGYNLSHTGMHQEAVKVLARNLNGESPHLMSLYFSSHSRIVGKFELKEAIKDLDRYINLSENNAVLPLDWAWKDKGLAFLMLGNKDEAFVCFEKVLKLDPQNSTAENKLKELRNKSTKK